MTDPNKLLERVLKLIDQDIKRIKKLTARKTLILDKDMAATLCKYANTISGIKEEKDLEDQKQKKALERLSTEELIAMYNKEKK